MTYIFVIEMTDAFCFNCTLLVVFDQYEWLEDN